MHPKIEKIDNTSPWILALQNWKRLFKIFIYYIPMMNRLKGASKGGQKPKLEELKSIIATKVFNILPNSGRFRIILN